MPIQTGQPIANQSERQDELLRQFLRGNDEMSNTAAQQAGQSRLLKQKSSQEQQAAEAELNRTKGLAGQYPGSMVKAGTTEVNPMPNVKQSQIESQQQVQALNKAQDTYNKGSKPIAGKLDTLEEMAAALKNPNQMSQGQLRSLALRTMGLSRFNQPEAAALVPPSAQGAFSRIASYAGGDAASVNPTQIKDLAEFANASLGSVKNAHTAAKAQAANHYASLPGARPEKLDYINSQMGSPIDLRIENLQKSLGGIGQSSGAPVGPASQGLTGAIKSGAAGIRSLIGKGAPSNDPQPSGGFNPDAYLQGK